MPSRGFSVNAENRNDVVAFWQAIYMASEGYEKRIKWTGNYSTSAGSVSKEFVADVERRLNYFRAMCGSPAGAQVNTGSTAVIKEEDPHKPPSSTLKSTAAQLGAMMLVKNFNAATGENPAMNHNPASSLKGWSTSAWNADANGNLAFGLYGPGAITEYMIEAQPADAALSIWNSSVGHRRWCLYPIGTDYATGDQPGASALVPPTNVFYVSQNASELASPDKNSFISYPPSGFFPAQLNTPFWSLSYSGADFSAAIVKMTNSAGTTVPLKSVRNTVEFGDPAIVWQVSAAVASQNVYNDTSYRIQVSGIEGPGVPKNHSYSVTLINPNRITSNQSVSGSASPKVAKTTTYNFTPPPGSEALQVEALIRQPATWVENAENAKTAKIIDGTGSNYSLMALGSTLPGFGAVSKKASFRLTFPVSYDLIARGVPDQFFEIDREILPNKGAKLSFLFRRGFMTTTSILVVETSNNQGITWKPVGKPIKGVSNTQYDTGKSTMSIGLPVSSTPLRVRFRFYTTGGALYTHESAPKLPTGIFIDDIKTSRCDWLERKKLNVLAKSTTKFAFNSTTAGTKLVKGQKWYLRLKTRLGGKYFTGPPKPVTIR